MEQWEYASGYELLDGFTNHGEPTTFERAQRDLNRLISVHGDENWVINPCVVKRSTRYPNWTPVHDHAAELLAEVLTDIALKFAPNGNDIMQGKDLNRVIKHVAFSLRPVSTEEYDS